MSNDVKVIQVDGQTRFFYEHKTKKVLSSTSGDDWFKTHNGIYIHEDLNGVCSLVASNDEEWEQYLQEREL